MLSRDAWREGQTFEVDLTKNPRAKTQCFQGIVRFLSDGAFDCGADACYAFGVRGLADEYRLTRLVAQVDRQLEQLLSEDNVLEFLGHVEGSTDQSHSTLVPRAPGNLHLLTLAP